MEEPFELKNIQLLLFTTEPKLGRRKGSTMITEPFMFANESKSTNVTPIIYGTVMVSSVEL